MFAYLVCLLLRRFAVGAVRLQAAVHDDLGGVALNW